MRALGLRDDDALFPLDRALAHCRQLRCEERAPIAPWSTEDGIRRAFQRGSKAAGIDYINPHAVRHALTALGRSVCRSAVEEQAWSQNLGHSGLRVTRSHYAKMDDEQCGDMFCKLYRRDQAPEEDEDLLILYHEHQLHPDTPEFKRAERLNLERMKSRCGEPATTAKQESDRNGAESRLAASGVSQNDRRHRIHSLAT